ncbi:MAG: hypothetical protein WCO89_05680 [Syntrophus sp. (in: bacteria)]
MAQTTSMTSGHFLTSQIFDAHINKSMLSSICAMPDSGIPGKLAFDSVVMGENQQLMSKIKILPCTEEVKEWVRLKMSWE